MVKIEKKQRSEEGIDCLEPVIWEPMISVTKPNLNNIKTSFLDSKSQELIVVADKIYFLKLNDFVSHIQVKESEQMVFDAKTINRILQEDTAGSKQPETAKTPNTGVKDDSKTTSSGKEEIAQVVDGQLEYSEIGDFQNNSFELHPDFIKAIGGNFSLMIYISTFENETTSGGKYHPFHVFVYREHIMVIDSTRHKQFYVKLDIKPHILNRYVLSIAFIFDLRALYEYIFYKYFGSEYLCICFVLIIFGSATALLLTINEQTFLMMVNSNMHQCVLSI